MLRILEQPEVLPRYANGSAFVARLPVPSGLIRGISFDLSGTPVGTITDNQDDAPWTLISDLAIVLPLRRGDVTIRSTGRDLFLLSRYLLGKVRENAVAADNVLSFHSFLLPFGPRGWGIHSNALRAGAEIIIRGTWAAATEYGAGGTGITAGILRPSLYVESAVAVRTTRRALIPTTSRLSVESAARFPKVRLNKPELAEGLFAVLYRQDDASVAADRVDGLVTRLVLHHSVAGELHDQYFRSLRGSGMEWAGIDLAEVAAATPAGLDGTAFYVAAPTFEAFPSLARAELALTYDAAETVQPGATNVVPAAGDALLCTVVSTILPGA